MADEPTPLGRALTTDRVLGNGRGVNLRDSSLFRESPPIDPFEHNLRDAFDEMVELLVKKRKAYGPGNLVQFGSLGIAVRASDKVYRLANLLQSGEKTSADGESIEDAFRDLCGYGILGLLHERGKLVT